MYKFPPTFDVRSFVRRKLEMVCFNANQIYFHFDCHVVVCAESTFQYGTPGSSSKTNEVSVPSMQSNLMQLLEHEVIDASIRDGHVLALQFDDGSVLRFYEASPTYESYRVTVGGETIII